MRPLRAKLCEILTDRACCVQVQHSCKPSFDNFQIEFLRSPVAGCGAFLVGNNDAAFPAFILFVISALVLLSILGHVSKYTWNQFV